MSPPSQAADQPIASSSSSSHQLDHSQPSHRPTRKIKTRSMTSANPKAPRVPFGAHPPSKAPARTRLLGTSDDPNQLATVNVVIPSSLAHRHQEPQPTLKQIHRSSPDRRPSTRQKTGSNSHTKPQLHSPVVVIDPSNVPKPSDRLDHPLHHSPPKPPPTSHLIFQPNDSTRSPALPQPTVIIPNRSRLSNHSAMPKKVLEPPDSRSNKARPGAPEPPGNPSSPSHPTRRKSPSKAVQARRKKRLFEEINNSSNDIFSFLDNKSRANKSSKPSTRPVFKYAQSSFPRTTKLSAPEPQKTHLRNLASSRLLAGVRPPAKRFKRAMPEPASGSLKQHSESDAVDPKSSSLDTQNLGTQTEAGSHLERCMPSHPPPPPTPKINDRSDAPAQCLSAPSPPPLDQPASSSANRAMVVTQDPRALLPVELEAVSPSVEPRDDSSTTLERRSESTSVQPISSTLSLSTYSHPHDNQVSSDLSIGETSADAIDFLSPKKNPLQPCESEVDSLSVESQVNPGDAPREDTLSDRHPPHIDSPPERRGTVIPSEGYQDENIGKTVPSPPFNEPPAKLDGDYTLTDSNGVQSHSPAYASACDKIPCSQNPASTLPGSSDVPPPSAPPSWVISAEKNPPNLSHGFTESSTPSNPLIPAVDSQAVTFCPLAVVAPEAEAIAKATTRKASPKLIPTRTSPIKYPTLPTSIPILKPASSLTSSSSPTRQNPVERSKSSSSSIEQAAKRPSLLPRRALKPSMGTNQPLTFNVVPSLDAIIENSPEKRPVRDALSAASLNRSRGFGAPSRVIFTGGIKSKAEGIFARPPTALTSASSTSFGYSVNSKRIDGNQIQHNPIQPSTSQGSSKADGEKANTKENEIVQSEDLSIDTSFTSIANISSDTSLTSHQENPIHNLLQSSGNISMDTQDRLIKLQNMLTKMGRSQNTTGQSNRTSVDRGAKYFEYEVSLKDESEEEEISEKAIPTVSSRARRRSSSVPLNYSENQLSRSVSRQNSATVTKTNSTKHNAKTGPTPRRVSNILPSARIDSFTSNSPHELQASSSKSCLSSSTSALSSANPSSSTSNPSSTFHSNSSSGHSSTHLSGVDKHHQRPPAPLKDVIAFVDVRTAEGDDAGKVFVEMLKGLGAKVVGRLIFPLTHIVFKAGRQTTIERYMLHPKPKPKLVGIGWVVRCREILSKADEEPYKIESSSSPILFNLDSPHHLANIHSHGTSSINGNSGGVSSLGHSSHNRRKSMEPKALSLLQSGLQLNYAPSVNADSVRHPLSRSCFGKLATTNSDSLSSSATSTANPPTTGAIDPNQVLAESIDRARRKSLQFLPKVGSPLANKVYVPDETESDRPPGSPTA